MKTKTLVSCFTGGLLLAACGSEAPPIEPPGPDDLEGDPVVIATAEAAATAAGTLTATGAGGAASAATGGAATTTGMAASAASSGTGGSSAEASSSTESGGAAGAPNGQGGVGGSPDVATEGPNTGSSGAGAAGQPLTTGEPPPPPPVVIGAVLITEYVENGNDKAIELSNLGTNSASLAACRLELYFNGNPEPTNTIDLAVELAPGRSHVLCRSTASEELLALCDQTTASLSFNGDDTVVLRCDDLVHDSFGQLGSDPGTAWRSGEPSGAGPWNGAFGSVDHVLRRRCGAAPRTQPTDPFEIALTMDWFPVWSFVARPATGAPYDGVGDPACTAPEPVAGAGGAASLE